MNPIEYKCGKCGKSPFRREIEVINHQNSVHGGDGKILMREEGEKEWS